MDGEQALHLGTEPVDGIELFIGFLVLRVHGHFLTSLKAVGEVPMPWYRAEPDAIWPRKASIESPVPASPRLPSRCRTLPGELIPAATCRSFLGSPRFFFPFRHSLYLPLPKQGGLQGDMCLVCCLSQSRSLREHGNEPADLGRTELSGGQYRPGSVCERISAVPDHPSMVPMLLSLLLDMVMAAVKAYLSERLAVIVMECIQEKSPLHYTNY